MGRKKQETLKERKERLRAELEKIAVARVRKKPENLTLKELQALVKKGEKAVEKHLKAILKQTATWSYPPIRRRKGKILN